MLSAVIRTVLRKVGSAVVMMVTEVEVKAGIQTRCESMHLPLTSAILRVVKKKVESGDCDRR